MRAIFDNAPDGMFVIDQEAKLVDGNAAATALTGYARGELIGQNVLELNLLPPEDLTRATQLLAVSAAGECTGPDEFLLSRKDGEQRLVEIRSHPITIGRQSLILGIARDITEREQAAEALRESEEQYRILVEQSLMGIGVSRGNRVEFANATLLRMFGYDSLEEFARIPLLDHVAPSSREMVADIMRRLRSGEMQQNDFEYDILRADGTTRTLHAFSSHFLVSDTVCTQTTFEDVTERVEAEKRTRTALEGTIQAVVGIIETRDPSTAGHQERVTKLAVAIAQRMALPDERIEGIRVAATLHDIGKVATPAEILSKPGRLSEYEFKLIQEHPRVAHNILKGITFPWPVADIVLQHHERLDGSGYPTGLEGENILLEARIIAVADTVEAMSSHRPYRAALGCEAALREIKQHEGTRYDPDVVAACIDLFESGELSLDCGDVRPPLPPDR